MVAEDTYGVGIDEAGDQELPSCQIQSLELPTVADVIQECVHISSGGLDSLDDTVLTDVEECVGESFVGSPVDGGDESARDKERHLTVREISHDGTTRGKSAE